MQLTYDDLKLCASMRRNAELYSEQIMRLRAMAERSTVVISPTGGIKSGRSRGRMEPAVCKLADMEKSVQAEIEAYIDHVVIVWEEINKLKDPNHRLVMSLRYIEGMIWEDIAKQMHYYERHCRRLHDDALEIMKIVKLDDEIIFVN